MPVSIDLPGPTARTNSYVPNPSAYVAKVQPMIPALTAEGATPNIESIIEHISLTYDVSYIMIFAYERLDSLKLLGAGWDGYDAEPIRDDLIASAYYFLYLYSQVIGIGPRIVPMSRGRLQFEWNQGNRCLEIEFENSGEIHYLKWDPDEGVEDEDIVPIKDRCTIMGLLRWFSAETRNGRSARTRSAST